MKPRQHCVEYDPIYTEDDVETTIAELIDDDMVDL